MGLLITFVLGLFFLVGALIIRLTTKKELIEHLSIAMAFGAMIAIGVFDLIPDIIEEYEVKQLWLPVIFILVGVGMLKLLDRFIPEHNDSGEEETLENLVHIGFIAAVAISIHNIVEGMTVYSMALQSTRESFSLAIGVGLHNIPMGMLIYSTLEKEHGFKKNFVLAISVLSTFVGGILMALVSPFLTEGVISALVCVALGMVIYILLFELFPSIYHEKNKRVSIIGTVLGVCIVFLSMLFE